MERYILDTNLFFNIEAGLGLGEKSEEVIKKVTAIGRKIKKEKRGEFLMPPSAVSEFLSFFPTYRQTGNNKNQQFIKDFLSVLTIKSPDYGRLTIPAQVFYQLVEEVRQRSYRGLNIGEEEIEKAGRLIMEQTTKLFLEKEKSWRETIGVSPIGKKDFQIKIGEVIKRFRQRYRQATRVGFLDSVTDLDLIVLAKETEGFLVSTDEGVLRWGRIFGVKELPASVWRQRLEG
ncbi:MAG: RNA ligase partner protein [Microgenomates group bacterium]